MWIREYKPQDALKIAFAVLYKCNHMYMVLEKAEEPEIKLPISAGLWKKEEFQKNLYFCFSGYAKAFDCLDHNKL